MPIRRREVRAATAASSSSGAGIAPRGEQGPDIHVTDIAPTLLYLVGSPVPAHMSGKVALELLDARLLAQRPVRQSPALSRDDRRSYAGLVEAERARASRRQSA